jgi:hypothetical protein
MKPVRGNVEHFSFFHDGIDRGSFIKTICLCFADVAPVDDRMPIGSVPSVGNDSCRSSNTNEHKNCQQNRKLYKPKYLHAYGGERM